MSKKQELATTTGHVSKYDYGDRSGKGYEHQTQDDLQTPMILVLQALSKVVTKKTVPGAEAGLLFNNVTNELAKELLFVPAITTQVYVEWVPREKGGGFAGIHDPHSQEVANSLLAAGGKQKDMMIGENNLVRTFQVWGVLCDDKEPLGVAMLPCSSSKIRIYKAWNTKTRQFMPTNSDGEKFLPPMFSHLVRLKTVYDDSNPSGDFYNLVMEPANGDVASSQLSPDDPRFVAAEECYELSEAGALKQGAYDKATSEEAGTSEKNPF